MDTFITNDMAMAAFLELEGHTPQKVEWTDDTCRWTFMLTEMCQLEVEEFQTDAARVNPREYTKYFAKAKREFHNSKPSEG